jgi:hypothetical protein
VPSHSLALVDRELLEDFLPESTVLLHCGEFRIRQFAFFKQNIVRHTDFADIMQSCGLLQSAHHVLWQFEFFRDDASVASDSQNMLTGIMIAVLGGARQAVQHILSRGLELRGAKSNRRLEIRRVFLETVLVLHQ